MIRGTLVDLAPKVFAVPADQSFMGTPITVDEVFKPATLAV